MIGHAALASGQVYPSRGPLIGHNGRIIRCFLGRTGGDALRQALSRRSGGRLELDPKQAR